MTTRTKLITYTIFNIPIISTSKVELISVLKQKILNNKKTMLAFANANTLNIAYDDEHYAGVLKSFLVVNDGVGVDIAARILFNCSFLENLNGTDFMPEFFLALPGSTRLYFLGSTEKNIRKVEKKFKIDFPHLELVGVNNGYFENKNDIIEKINSSRPNVVVVGFGNPKQEIWIENNNQDIDASLFIGVGAFFDFYSGEITRAPEIIRKCRLEWFYRLILEPKRLWKRYIIGNFLFLVRVLKQKFA